MASPDALGGSRSAITRRGVLRAGAGAALGLTGASALIRPARAHFSAGGGAQSPVVAGTSPFGSNYLARNTVFTRDASSFLPATNSAFIARYVAQQPVRYVTGSFKRWLRTGLNTTQFTTPIYLVDSTLAGHDRATVTMVSAPDPSLSAGLAGEIPIPAWAQTASGPGREALAIYDIGAGVLREYSWIVRTGLRTWEAAGGGFHRARPGLRHLAGDNYAMQLDAGANTATGMLSSLAQIGIDEVRSGAIGHAVAVSLADASQHGHCWPARAGRGSDNYLHAPRLGQWFRLPADLDVDALGLNPLTLLIARAVQRHGGFGADTSRWSHAFHCEHPATEIHHSTRDPWAPEGELQQRLGTLDVNDFPWHLTEWAAVADNPVLSPGADLDSPSLPPRAWRDQFR